VTWTASAKLSWREEVNGVPKDVVDQLQQILDERKLRRINVVAGSCADLNAFRAALASPCRRAKRA
jgi:hypothetical protein